MPILSLLLPLTLLITQDPRLGPSHVEQSLREALERAVVQATDEPDLAALLRQASPPPLHRSAEELARGLHCAAALVEGGAPDDGLELPRDPALLRLLARRFPVPTPVSWIPFLRGELGQGEERDAALVEWLAKVPGEEGLQALLDLEREAQALLRPPAVHGVLLDRLRPRVRLDHLEPFFRARLSAHPGVAWFGNQALWDVVGRRSREGEAVAAARHLEAFGQRMPPGTTFLLDGAARLLREGQDLELARTLLRAALTQTEGGRDSGSLMGHAEACLGLAGVEFLEGASWADIHAWIVKARDHSRAPLEDEREVLVLDLRAGLLERFLGRLVLGQAVTDYDEFLVDVRREYDQNLLDQAWFGPFGPHLLRTELRRQGRAGDLLLALEELVEAVERTTPQTGFGLRDRHPDQEERPLSWLFLSLAESLLEDRGDPQAANDFLEWRQAELKKMSSWANLDLLVNTAELLAQARLYLRAPGAAKEALDGAAETATALRQSFEDHLVRRIDEDKMPLPAGQYWLWRKGPAFHGLLVRAYLLRATVHSVLEGDPTAAAHDLFQSGEYFVWGDARWTAVALDHSRRGFSSLAARSVSLVETWRDRSYDRACIASFLGRPDDAIRYLRHHLEEECYTAAGRAQERAYMAADPDLSALRGHPEFPHQ